MNSNITMLCKSDLEEIKFKALSDLYNAFAKELNLKPIKKFKDKTTGVQRIVAIQEQYSTMVFKELEAKKTHNAEVETYKAETGVKYESKSPILYKVSTVKPKSESSAMGIIYRFVEDKGTTNLEDLCEHFLSEYSLQYKGKAKLSISFAKAYIKGAVRASNIRTV